MPAFVKMRESCSYNQLHFLLLVWSPLNRPCMLIFEIFLLLQESLSDIFGMKLQ